MKKIMELAEAYRASHRCIADFAETNGDKERAALQAEVTRLEIELVHWKESRQSAIDAGELMKTERDELRAKLAVLEAQEPVAALFLEYKVASYGVPSAAAIQIGWSPLYLAAGAKEKP